MMLRSVLRPAVTLGILLIPALAIAQSSAYLLAQVRLGGIAGSNFGKRTILSGDIAAISANARDDVHLYGRNVEGPDAWGEIIQLNRGQPGSDSFGAGADLEATRLAVGAPFSNEVLFDGGAVWIYERDAGGPDNWGEVRQITPDDHVALDHFGSALDLEGDLLLVGSFGDNHNNLNDPGSAYLFERNAGGTGNWGQVAHLFPGDPVANASCGQEVALDGDVAAMACPGADAVYVFERDAGGTGNWGQVAKLASPTPDNGFGTSIALLGDLLAVGAEGDDEAAIDAGAVYFYTRTAVPPFWGAPEKLMLDTAIGGEEFGKVAMTADWLLIGAPSDSSVGSRAGAAYLYAPDPGQPIPWMLVAKLTAFDRHADDHYGSPALEGDLAVVAARSWRSPDDGRPGAAYIYCLHCSTILADGFESGDTRRWSDTVP